MAIVTNYTLQDIADLESALAAGVLRVEHNGVMTIFQKRDDMVRQVALMKRELGVITDEVRTPGIRRLRFMGRKGF
jgi:hypothetical protein